MGAITSAVLLAGSAAMSLAGAASSSSAQKKQAQAGLNEAYYNAAMNEMQAEDIKRKATDDANLQLRQAAHIRSTQQTQIAANGMMLGQGSAQTIIDETTRLSTADALVTLYNGIDGYTTGMSQSENIRTAGKANADAGFAAANSTMMSGFASAAGTIAGGFQNKTWQNATAALTTKK